MSSATLHTNHGPIELELFEGDAPTTVENFRKLAGDGFYDGVIFHRDHPRLHDPGRRPDRHRHGRPRLHVRGRVQRPPGRARRARDGERRPEHERQPVLHRHRGRVPVARRQAHRLRPVTNGMDVVDTISAVETDARTARARTSSSSGSISELGHERQPVPEHGNHDEQRRSGGYRGIPRDHEVHYEHDDRQQRHGRGRDARDREPVPDPRPSAPCCPGGSGAGGTSSGRSGARRRRRSTRKATTNTSRWNSVTRVQPFANGTASRNASRTVTPGRTTRSSFSSSISSRSARSFGVSSGCCSSFMWRTLLPHAGRVKGSLQFGRPTLTCGFQIA